MLLSLLNDDEEGCAIDPDYTKSVSDVYKETMMKIMDISGDWNIFGSVEMDEGVIRIPSWISDWSVPKSCSDMRFGDQPNEVSDYDGGGVLCLESEHGEDAGAFILVLEVIEERWCY